MPEVRVLVADDHELVRDGIKARIESQPGWRVCCEVSDGRAAVEQTLQHHPHIAVLDIGMPVLNGLAATERIRKESPETQVLILTMQSSDDIIRDALAAGARGFLLKTDAGRSLIAAISALLAGKPFFSGPVADVVLGGYLNPDREVPVSERRRLTSRETEILQLLAEGRSAKGAAAALGVSVHTIEAHRANIMRKLDLHSVAELVLYAVRNRIVEP